MGEVENTYKGKAPLELCDDCKVGRQKRCPHAYDYHDDSWGNRIDLPEYCPNTE